MLGHGVFDAALLQFLVDVFLVHEVDVVVVVLRAAVRYVAADGGISVAKIPGCHEYHLENKGLF